jgi:predicted Zn-dependent protease
MRCRRLAGVLLALTTGPALGQTAPEMVAPLQSIPPLATAPLPAAGVAEDAVAVLLRQARYWLEQYQNDRAIEALNRALTADPANAEAAALLARIEAEQGDSARATAALWLLRQHHPDDPAIAHIEAALRVGAIPATSVEPARALARQGRNAEAIQLYNTIFHGNPPPEPYEVEYYQALAATEGGWDSARNALARVVRDDPQDSSAALAYAELLTYREASRDEGIARLVKLAGQPDVADAATRAWRQALLWLPVAPASSEKLAAFLQLHPDDADIRRQLRLAQAAPRDTTGQQRQAAFRQLDAGHLAEAEHAFRQVLDATPDDPDAIGGMGLLRLRQGRAAEARSLLARAISLDPAKRRQWQAALQAASASADDAAIGALTDQGDYDAAERRIRALMQGGGNSVTLSLMLGRVQSSRGDLASAEATYRAVLQRQPDNSAAMLGLAAVLERQGRFAQAEQVLSRAGGAGSPRTLGRIRAERLRDQAAQTADVATRQSLLEEALAADPASPWVRLDLARLLAGRMQMARARALMAELTAPADAGPDALQAGILFAAENGLLDDGAALAARVPASGRSTAMRAALAQLQVRQTIAAARLLPAPAASRRLLAQAAAAPDPDGMQGAALARALLRMGDADAARQAIRAARAATPAPTPDQALNYASVLLEIGDTKEAAAMLASADAAGSLSPAQQETAQRIGRGLAVREADRLNRLGRQADAYDILAPALAQSPDDPDLNLALGRLYGAADDPRRALTIALAVLRRNPASADARRGAVTAALAAGDRATADTLVREGLAQTPDEPKVWLAASDLERSTGDNRAALISLTRARDLRDQQIGLDPPAGSPQEVAVVTIAPGANPFRDGPAPASPGDGLSAEIDHSMTELRASMAPATEAGAALRNRSGTSGLSALTDLSLPLEASFSPGGVGRLRLLAQPVFLFAGSVGASASAQSQFGTQALSVGPSGLHGPIAGGQNASGVLLNLAYSYGWLDADIGGTPIGFPVQTVVGGISLAPHLTDTLVLRLTGERRAVTESLLSYGGQTDPRTGLVFGGVVRDRIHAQAELSAGPALFYAGIGYDSLTGQHVADNGEIEAGAGVGFPITRRGAGELRSGLDLVYFGFDKNLSGFTLGQGGYFSPQSYFAALVPLTWSAHTEDLTYSVGGALGYQVYNTSASPYFPTSPALQAQWGSQAVGLSGFATTLSSTRSAGLTGNVHGEIEYRITPNLLLGARAGFTHAGDYSEAEALLYARYLFTGAQ